MLALIASPALIVVLGFSAAACAIASLIRALGMRMRATLALTGIVLCALNFLCQIAHTLDDVLVNDMICIMDTQPTLFVCSALLFAFTTLVGSISLVQALRAIR